MPLYIGLLNGLCSIVRDLVGFPGQRNLRLYSVMRRAMDYISCLGTAGVAAIKLVRFLLS